MGPDISSAPKMQSKFSHRLYGEHSMRSNFSRYEVPNNRYTPLHENITLYFILQVSNRSFLRSFLSFPPSSYALFRVFLPEY